MQLTFRSLILFAVATLLTLSTTAEAAKWPFGSDTKAQGRFSIVKEYSAAYGSHRPANKKLNKKATKKMLKARAKAKASRNHW